ncbi:MAG TPA: hypothetical protein VFE15_07610 [Marmoricola sp.]|jgi:uncharacterized membrane protein|nr:hypothetical protein [Marmoricola sp.]
MKQTSRAAAVAVLVGAVLAVAAVLIAFDNPTLHHSSLGTYDCLAPYDHVLLGTSNLRDIEKADVVRRCDSADDRTFAIACVVAGAGVLVGVGGVVGLVRRRRVASVSTEDDLRLHV